MLLSASDTYIHIRFLLGFLQGGFIPDVVLYLSYFYTKKEREYPSTCPAL